MTTITTSLAMEKVNQIDLTPINKVLQYENPDFWTDEIIKETEASYRQLLVLNLLYPEETIVVNKIIDDYWHQHILDTKKYAEDCEKMFGYFLHHYPYYGINGEDDKENNRVSFAVTQQLWQLTFGTPMVTQPELTLNTVLGIYDTIPKDLEKNRVYTFPKTCKCGQHCNRTIVPDIRINPLINPQIDQQSPPQVRIPAIRKQPGR